MKEGYDGKLMFLPVGKLNVEPRYQRAENLRMSKEIARDLNPPAFGVLVVSKRNGSYYVIDGQRRALAASIAKMKTAPCMVWGDLELKAEADAYWKVNNLRQGTHPVNKWASSLFAEHPETVEANRVLAQYGYKVTYARSRKGSPHINVKCGGVMMGLHHKGLLGDTLHFLTACWDEHEFIGQANTLRAAGKFIQLLNEAEEHDNPAKIMKRFKAVPAVTIEERARGFLQAGNHRSMPAAIVAVFVSIYNKGRRIGKLPVTI